MKITKAQVEALILSKTFTTLPSGRAIVCELILKNGVEGQCVVGTAFVNTLADFDQQRGEEASYAKALDAAWPFAVWQHRLDNMPQINVPPFLEINIKRMMEDANAIDEEERKDPTLYSVREAALWDFINQVNAFDDDKVQVAQFTDQVVVNMSKLNNNGRMYIRDHAESMLQKHYLSYHHASFRKAFKHG